MPRPKKTDTTLNLSAKTYWPKTTELVSLEFILKPTSNTDLYAQYTIGLHAWLLHQIRDIDPDLSAYMHDGESEKSFSMTGLDGQFIPQSQSLQLQRNKHYRWRVKALNKRVVQGFATWLRNLPKEIVLKDSPLTIESVSFAHPPTTYAKLLEQGQAGEGSINLSFHSPTSFRRKGHHLPLPWPANVFHSYLRRWNHFSNKPVNQEDFLDWVDTYVIINQHHMSTAKVAAGKQGSVIGFTGAVTYAIDRRGITEKSFVDMFYTLTQLAPYCGTGHKTTFGLGETQLGWHTSQAAPQVPTQQRLLAERMDELTEIFLSTKKRQGGRRAIDTAETWATILARREMGDSLQEIADDMELAYETAKTYSKLARRTMRELAGNEAE
ncbi:MAG: CRISPR-associated endoribonuclease Cas6 [Cyanobacteria bacterium P01_H01_bin.21]